MFSPPTPATSPLAHLAAKSSYVPLMFQSSPLTMGSSSPTSAMQARRRREYKSQSSSRSVVSGLEDTPQKQFLRDRFKARCLERARENRARAVRKGRSGSSVDGGSSDGFDMDDDSTIADEEDEDLDDELYRRVMMNEERRARHSKRVSFEQDFGSSIDPNMCDDMETLERELTGKSSKYNVSSPPDDGFEDDLIQEYLAELEEIEREEEQRAAYVETGVIDLDREDPVELEREFTRESDLQQPSPTRSMYSEVQMSSPPSSPSRPTQASAMSPTKSTSTWTCPFCSTGTPRAQIACVACMAQYPLEHATSAWNDPDSHPGGQQSNHIPLVTTAPSIGAVMLCGAPGCDWGYAL